MTDPVVLLDLTMLDTPSRQRGMGRYARDLALGLAALPADERAGVDLLALTRLAPSGAYEVTRDLAAFEGNADVPHPTSRDHYRVAYTRRVALALAARRIGAAWVHLTDPNATPLARFVAPTRWLVTCHDLIALRFPERYFSARDGWGFVGRRLERRRYASADAVVAISDATRDDVVSLLGIDPARVTRVHNGVDLARWRDVAASSVAPAVERHGLTGRPYLLYVGDTDWRKNVDGMIAGLAAARREGSDVTLALAGVLSDERAAAVDALAAAAGVGDRVRRLGYVGDDDLPSLLRGALAHLFVSRAEGFGMTVVEAMACGCPVITTHAGSLGEVAGDAALLVDPEDHEAIGRAIVRLATQPAERERLVVAGRAQAERFSNVAQARAMMALYRRLATSG